jgi:hypothetical protein
MSASGYISDSGTQAPWSNGRCASSRRADPQLSAVHDLAGQGRFARRRVLHRIQGRGKPPKSCQVSGCALPVTSSSRLSQCADTTTMALGRGRRWPARPAPARWRRVAGRAWGNHGR